MEVEAKSLSRQVHVVILDDDQRIGITIRSYLKLLDCHSTVYTDPIACLESLAHTPADILITDLCMPGLSGHEVLEKAKKISPQTDVIVITGTADKEDAIKALKLGAFDFFEKPVDKDMITQTISRTLRYRQVAEERDLLAAQVSFLSGQERERSGISGMVSQSPAMKRVMHDVQLICKSPATSVLITGESGTGKELIARAIHFGSARARNPFVPINCSAVPAELAESTLFGHIRGAFTGAVADRKGCFELADSGTLFLDEIGDMPLEMQTKLLRVLEDGAVTAVGAPKARQVNVRIVAATNANIADQITNRKFRSDLYYRLAGYTITLPPLRQRRTEIPFLARHFNKLISTEMGIPPSEFDDTALAALAKHDFPGNVRELRNIVERALILCRGGTIYANHIHCEGPLTESPQASSPPAADARFSDGDLPLNLKEAEATLIRRALATANSNVAATARLLGISRPKLYRMMAAHDIGSS